MRLRWPEPDTFAGFCLVMSAVLGSIAALVLLLMVGLWHASHVECLRLHEQTGYATRMAGNAFGGGCFVNVHDRWIPASRYRSVDVDGE